MLNSCMHILVDLRDPYFPILILLFTAALASLQLGPYDDLDLMHLLPIAPSNGQMGGGATTRH